MTEYHKKGKHNPFDAHMAGFSLWITPRQIITLANMCEKYKDELEGIELEAFLDFKLQIDYEAEIKRKKYLGEE